MNEENYEIFGNYVIGISENGCEEQGRESCTIAG